LKRFLLRSAPILMGGPDVLYAGMPKRLGTWAISFAVLPIDRAAVSA